VSGIRILRITNTAVILETRRLIGCPKKQLAQRRNTLFNIFFHEKRGLSATGSRKNGNRNGRPPRMAAISAG
jgi:hypothetical protein